MTEHERTDAEQWLRQLFIDQGRENYRAAMDEQLTRLLGSYRQEVERVSRERETAYRLHGKAILDGSAAVSRAEKAEQERDEARARYAEALARPHVVSHRESMERLTPAMLEAYLATAGWKRSSEPLPGVSVWTLQREPAFQVWVIDTLYADYVARTADVLKAVAAAEGRHVNGVYESILDLARAGQ